MTEKQFSDLILPIGIKNFSKFHMKLEGKHIVGVECWKERTVVEIRHIIHIYAIFKEYMYIYIF